MATLEVAFLQNQLEERKRRLETAIALAPKKAGLAGLLREVDSAPNEWRRVATAYARNATKR
jgi:hypothetical protein